MNWASQFHLLLHFETKRETISKTSSKRFRWSWNPQLEFDGFLLVCWVPFAPKINKRSRKTMKWRDFEVSFWFYFQAAKGPTYWSFLTVTIQQNEKDVICTWFQDKSRTVRCNEVFWKSQFNKNENDFHTSFGLWIHS